MKRFMGALILVAMLVVPTVCFADGNQVGVYVVPKFVYGLTQTSGVKVHERYEHTRSPYAFNIGSNTDSTFGGSIALGYDFSKKFNVPIRAELEYSAFSKADKGKNFTVIGNTPTNVTYEKWSQSYQVQTLFLNAYWDIDTGTKFTPYFGAGLGMGFIGTKVGADGDTYDAGVLQESWDIKIGSKTVTNFAWNVSAGLGYDITDHWTIDAGYRFVGLGSVKTGTYTEPSGSGGTLSVHGKTDNLFQHQFSIGARYTF